MPKSNADRLRHQTHETTSPHEAAGRTPRFVIFGTRTDGSDEIAAHLSQAIKFIPGGSVEIASNAQSIKDCFYGRFGQPKIASPSSLGRAGRALLREAGMKVSFPITAVTPTHSEGPDTLPQGVVILSSMRQRDPWIGSGMTIPTPVGEIISLCEQHEVPFVRMEEAKPIAEQIQLARLLSFAK